MSIEIISGSLPHWDEQVRYEAYLPKDEQGNQTNHPLAKNVVDPFHAAYAGVARQKRLGNLSVDDLVLIVGEALKDNQGYHCLDPNGNLWRVQFPYARYISLGDDIRNLTTNEVYTVALVIDKGRRDVLLSGNTPPTSTDRLRLTQENEIVLTHGYPRSFVNSQKQDTTSDQADQAAPLNDTITFLVKKSQPHNLGKTPFQNAARVLRPQFRESLWDPDRPDEMITVEGWKFYSVVCFDCWSRDNDRAANLLAYFEDFMFRCKWIFELFGLSKVFYWQRNEDEEVYRWRADITKRTVEYLVETERLFFSRSTRVKDIQVQTQMRTTTDLTDPADVLRDDILLWPEPSTNIDMSIAHLGS